MAKTNAANPPTGDTKSEGILHLPEDEQKALFTEAADKSSKRQAETMKPLQPLQPQSEIRKILRALEKSQLFASSLAARQEAVDQAEALIEEEITRRVVEALKKLEAQLPRHFSPEDEDNSGFSGTWHLDTYKLAIEDCRSDIKEAIRIAQLTQEKK